MLNSNRFFIDNTTGICYIVNVFYEGVSLVIEISGDIPLVSSLFIRQVKGGEFIVKLISG